MNQQQKSIRFYKQPDWFQKYFIGIAEKLNYYVVYEGKFFALVKADGFSWYCNGWTGMTYSPTSYYIVPICTEYWHNSLTKIWEGRCKKDKIEEFKKYINECDNGLDPDNFKLKEI